MIENVMHNIGGVGLFGIISISLFFAFFLGMALWAVTLKKSYLSSMQQLPLEDGSQLPLRNAPIAPKAHDSDSLITHHSSPVTPHDSSSFTARL
jgi:cytochrome c oxidase cbb3-type subunit 4